MICCDCKQDKGGKFRWLGEGDRYRCQDCDSVQIRDAAKNIWEFTTTNIGTDPSKPIQVTSLRHLRQLEKQHGVISVAANYDSGHWDR